MNFSSERASPLRWYAAHKTKRDATVRATKYALRRKWARTDFFGRLGNLFQKNGGFKSFRWGLWKKDSSYAAKYVINADDTELFFSMPPEKSMAILRLPGRKKKKKRITILPCWNADGSENLELMFISMAWKPRLSYNIVENRTYILLQQWQEGYDDDRAYLEMPQAFPELSFTVSRMLDLFSLGQMCSAFSVEKLPQFDNF